MSRKFYRDNPALRKAGVPYAYSQHEVDEWKKCSNDPIYFTKNYVKIVSLDEGLINFDLRDYQEKLINILNRERFVVNLQIRQSGKTSTYIAYFLWLTLFHDNQLIAFAAHQASLSKEILARYKLAYENLPKFLQQGVISWNKTSIELENGCKIKTAATTGTSLTGESFNIVFLDEFAKVPKNIAENFFSSIYPVITSGTKTKIFVVSTAWGINHFYKLWQDALDKKNSYFPYEVKWWQVPGHDEAWKEETIRNTSIRQFQQEFENEFLGSSNTLINGIKLRTMIYKNPLRLMNEGMQVFEEPIKAKKDEEGRIISKQHLYVLVADTAEGKELDYSAFSVIDVTETPYKQVAAYRDNLIPTLLYPTIIWEAATMYNNAFVLLEVNTVGKQVADILHFELEYEHILKVSGKSQKKMQLLSAGHDKNVNFGLMTSPATKKIGCANLKTLIETDKLITYDFHTKEEFGTFVLQKNGTFKAEEGYNDDMVMGLVIFGWLTTQRYFKDLLDHSLRKELRDQQLKVEEHIELPPKIIISDAKRVDFEDFDGSGDVWMVQHEGSSWNNPYANFWDRMRDITPDPKPEEIEKDIRKLVGNYWY